MEGTNFMKEFQRLSLDTEFTDAVIKCGGREWKVHRNILACHGKFFKRCWQRGFVESETHVLDLVDDDPEAVDALLGYAYKFDYDDMPKEGSDFANALELDATVLALADKYECVDLANMAVKKFTFAAVAASKLTAPPYEAIRIVYNSTPSTDRRLRDVCMKLWAVMDEQVEKSKDREQLTRFLDEDAEFPVDVLFLAPSRWQKVGELFELNATDGSQAAWEAIHEAYRGAVPYCRIFDSSGKIVQAVTAMLRDDLEFLCKVILPWTDAGKGLMARITCALDPQGSAHMSSALQGQQVALDGMLERRARLQLRRHWIQDFGHAESATNDTFNPIFSDFEMCYTVFFIVRNWKLNKIDEKVGIAWWQAEQDRERKIMQEEMDRAAEVAAELNIRKAQDRVEQQRQLTQNFVEVQNRAAERQIVERQSVKREGGWLESQVVQHSFDTLRAEREASEQVNSGAGQVAESSAEESSASSLTETL